MKRLYSSIIYKGIVVVLLFMMCPVSVWAQYYMNVFRNDGARVLFDVAKIDSVSFNTTNESYQLVIYADYSLKPAYFYTNKIDSITYRNTDRDIEAASYSVWIISDNILAYDSDDWAVVRFETTPRDLLLRNDNIVVGFSDTSGTPDNSVTIGSREFSQTDSLWQLKVKIGSGSISERKGAVSLKINDVITVSNAVTLKKVTFKMRSVRVSGAGALKYDSKKNLYSACLPTTTNFSAQRIMFSHTGDSVTAGGLLMANAMYNTVDITDTLVASVWKDGLHKDYKIKLTNTGLPVVRISTPKAVTRRDTWVPGATIRIELPDGSIDYEGTLSLKGRGNGTWTDSDKKPYALKLDEKAKILGMHKDKRWILLANFKDRTLLRNDAAFWLSRQTEMPYTISGEFVELVWNGKHMGNYYLCEYAKIDNHRIDIHEPNLSDPEKGGYYMEIDAFLDYTSNDRADKPADIGFWSTGANRRYNLPYVFKEPDEDENGNPISVNSPAYMYMFNYVNKMEDAIYSASSNNHNWMKYLDMEAAIDYALIQELTMNHDSYNTWPQDGPHSAFIYKDSCGKICFGPIWDFDYHTFTLYSDYQNGGGWSSTENPRLKQWEILKMDKKNNHNYYFSDLVKKDPLFKSHLVLRWNMYKDIWKEGFPAYVDEMAEKIRLSESYNETIWGYSNKQNGDNQLTFQGAINAMKTAFLKRWEWIDQNIKDL